MGIQNLELLKPVLSNNDGDHERFAHWVKGKNEADVNAKLLDSMVNGTPVEALCGKVWVPSRDPKKFPVCPDCDRIAKEMGK